MTTYRFAAKMTDPVVEKVGNAASRLTVQRKKMAVLRAVLWKEDERKMRMGFTRGRRA